MIATMTSCVMIIAVVPSRSKAVSVSPVGGSAVPLAASAERCDGERAGEGHLSAGSGVAPGGV